MKRSTLIFLATISFTNLATARAVDQTPAANSPDSLNMTCSQAQEYVAKNDGANLRTGNVWASYHSSFCNSGSNPGSAPAYVRTRDQNLCFVGLSCNCHTGYCPQSFWSGVE